MPRKPRLDLPNRTFHIMNRSVGKLEIFNEPQDYKLFMKVLLEAWEITLVDIYAYCIMPNHFHILIRSHTEGDISKFMHALSNTYTRRLHVKTGTIGSGPVFKGRYKSILVEDGDAFNAMLQYIELNSVRAGLSKYSDEWEWCSSFARRNIGPYTKMLKELPIEIMVDKDSFREWIHGDMYKDQLPLIRESLSKGRPFGRPSWVELMVEEHGLEYTMRNCGRPRKLLN